MDMDISDEKLKKQEDDAKEKLKNITTTLKILEREFNELDKKKGLSNTIKRLHNTMP